MKNHRGFSLIELLITLTIIAVLICIAYPSYTQHLVATRRANATVALMDLAGKMEQYYAQNNKYAGATVQNLGEDNSGYKDYYQITISSTSDTTYNITATPIKAQADKLCGTMTIDQDNNKTISGTGVITKCW